MTHEPHLAIVRGTLILLAITGLLVWFLWRRLKKSADPSQLVFKWVLTWACSSPRRSPSISRQAGSTRLPDLFWASVYGMVLAILWAESLAGILANRIGALYDGGDVAGEPQPLYSVAEAKRKQGKYQEAICEIQGQLARFPHDITGQLMMAEIQAKHLADLPEPNSPSSASACSPAIHPGNWLRRSISWPTCTSGSAAIPRLPDSLREIIQLLPDTPEAQLAAQRIAHLRSAKDLAAEHDRVPIHLKAGVRDLGLKRAAPAAPEEETSPELLVGHYINQLEQYPQDAGHARNWRCSTPTTTSAWTWRPSNSTC